MSRTQKTVNQLLKTCDICKISTGIDVACELDYGPWMQKKGLQVHYFCLLLSTDLPQNGKDTSGILGFQLRDIRQCIMKAAKTECCYCKKCFATIKCGNCGVYFHMVCGEQRRCLFQFIDEFQSYCSNCIPMNEFQMKVVENNQTPNCYICKNPIVVFNTASWVYGPCCGNGFVHSICMRRYALSAGYYLKCIWCKSVDFRDMVRRLGVFVPDREADWERERNAFKDLHRTHQHCDMENCLCPNGRNYSSAKWELILCECCGGFGAHNPICIRGSHSASSRVETFKCSTCAAIESKSIIVPTNDAAHVMSNGSSDSSSVEEDNITVREKKSNFSNSSLDTVYLQPLLMSEDIPVDKEMIIDLCSQPVMASQNSIINDATRCEQVDAAQSTTITPPLPHESPHNTPNNEITKNLMNNTDGANFITFRCVTFNQFEKPSGIALVRIDLNSPRFVGRSLHEISENSMQLLEPQDIVSVTNDLEIINEIDRIIGRLVEVEKSKTNS